MVILIDGHNLIPKIHGLSLSHPDDEDRLILILQEYVRYSRKKVRVFFDGAPPGKAGAKKVGMVNVDYVSARTTADEAIIAFLVKRGKEAAAYLVVSSDQHVRTQAKAAGAAVMSSELFAASLTRTFASPPKTSKRNQKQWLERPLSEQEISEWIELFSSGPSEKYSE